jgi:hypothetical protein
VGGIMKKMLFIILSLFMLVGNVYASEVVTFYTVTNKCAVVKDNKAVIPVTIRSNNKELKLSSLFDELSLSYITNHEDVIKLNIYNINKDNIDVYVDYKRNSEGKSLVYYKLSEDIELKRHDELVSFDIGVEILNNYEIYRMDVFGNEVILADEATCEIVNGFKVTEIERIVDLSEIDHTQYINNLIKNIVIVILSISLVTCIILLIRKKK